MRTACMSHPPFVEIAQQRRSQQWLWQLVLRHCSCGRATDLRALAAGESTGCWRSRCTALGFTLHFNTD